MNRQKQQRGQTMSEYAIVFFMLLVALFVPWGGEPSAVARFLDAVRTYHTQASFPLSLP